MPRVAIKNGLREGGERGGGEEGGSERVLQSHSSGRLMGCIQTTDRCILKMSADAQEENMELHCCWTTTFKIRVCRDWSALK